LLRLVEQIGKKTIDTIEEVGYSVMVAWKSFYWIVAGKFKKQPVQMDAIFQEIVSIGVNAVLIVSILCFAVGIMLAIQGLETLKDFGAENKVILGLALAIPREFAPLIVGILVAGRTGSAITARIGTMQESQEIDALRVIGINPHRYISAPLMLAMLIVMPLLTTLGNFMALLGGGIYSSIEMGMSMMSYMDRVLEIIQVGDIMQGLVKCMVFSIIIVVVGISNGFQVRGGAEGVGKATTRSVVLSISYIVVADMIFTYFLNR